MGPRMAAVKHHIAAFFGFVLFEPIHFLAPGKSSGAGLDVTAEITVAHFFAPPQMSSVRTEKGDSGIDQRSKIIKK